MIELIQRYLESGSVLHVVLVLALVYLGGVATSFTPCVFPMIPITFSILGRSESGTVVKSVLIRRVLMYGLGVAFAFVGLGVAAVLTRTMFGSLTQSIVFKGVMASVFVYIGLSTLGVVRLPNVQVGSGDTQSYIGIMFLGMAAGLSLSPCTIPLLAVVLSVASYTSLALGALMMWMYAWGFMTLVLLLVVFGSQAMSSLFKKRSHLHIMDKLLAVMCFAVAAWILL